MSCAVAFAMQLSLLQSSITALASGTSAVPSRNFHVPLRRQALGAHLVVSRATPSLTRRQLH
eukprot:502511-Pleurochrysis_carterae.AAC.1